MSPLKGLPRSWIFEDVSSLGGATTTTTSTSSTSTSSTSSTSTTSTTDPFVAQYRTWYDAMTTPPSESVAEAQNTMVSGLVGGNNYWGECDYAYLLAQESNGDNEAFINIINPGTNNATGVNAPAFVSLEGFTSNGSSSYINTNIQIQTDFTKYLQNDAHMAFYIRTNTQSTGYMGGWGGAQDMYFQPRNTSGVSGESTIRINDETSITTASSDSSGLWIIQRTGANSVAIYRNGVEHDTGAGASETFQNAYEMYLLCLNFNGSPNLYHNAQLAYFSCGGALSEGQRSDLQTYLEAYMDSN